MEIFLHVKHAAYFPVKVSFLVFTMWKIGLNKPIIVCLCVHISALQGCKLAVIKIIHQTMTALPGSGASLDSKHNRRNQDGDQTSWWSSPTTFLLLSLWVMIHQADVCGIYWDVRLFEFVTSLSLWWMISHMFSVSFGCWVRLGVCSHVPHSSMNAMLRKNLYHVHFVTCLVVLKFASYDPI